MGAIRVQAAFQPLRDGATVAVVHPAGPLRGGEKNVQYAAGLAWLRRHFTVIPPTPPKPHPNGYLAGIDEDRWSQLEAALRDPSVEVIWAARGGYGCARIAPRLDAWLTTHATLMRPKHLIGFSDVTALLCVWLKHGWPALHGPVVKSLGGGPVVDKHHLLRLLRGQEGAHLSGRSAGEVFSGPLLGGNLVVLASLAGSGLLPLLPGAIWLFEEVTEDPYHVDRALQQLHLAGAFAEARGVLLGRFTGRDGKNLDARIAQLIDAEPWASQLRRCGGAPAGHTGQLTALPLGVTVTVDPVAGTLTWPVEALSA